jgi:SAM-dependent methyltransferase
MAAITGTGSISASASAKDSDHCLQIFLGRRQFRKSGGTARFRDLAPCLLDVDPGSQSGGGHYFYQDVWALRHLSVIRPSIHHDFGSRLDGFVAQATAICPIVYWDIRRPHFQLPDFEFRRATITKLPLEDGSVTSISCLHVAEHIGLGRYGDPIDPQGTEKALMELQRALAPGGVLLFSMPVGRERVEFNSQRVWNPMRPIELLCKMKLIEFSAVNDEGKFLPFINPRDLTNARYACGLYQMIRQKVE